MDRIYIYDSENKIDPSFSSVPAQGLYTMYMYITIIVKQFIGIYPRTQMSVYKTIGPLIIAYDDTSHSLFWVFVSTPNYKSGYATS